ncbi:MAG TPA: tetratricopeptide repeat protein [Thermoanaerobaculia bacterium]|nr:tetratricopeptide repeat protein [Thermoanaerobaculia bacterium]
MSLTTSDPGSVGRAFPDQPRLGFEALRQRGFEAVQAGSLPEATLYFERALEVAEGLGDQTRSDLALCNLAIVHVELCETDESVIERDLSVLRGILARTHSTENGWLASHHLARIYERRKAFKRGLFYARMALDRSSWVERVDWRAYSHNILGNLLLAESWLQDAVEHYERALALLESDDVWRARVLDNLGYCRALEGDLDGALSLLLESQASFQRHRAERYTLSNHLALAYVHLRAGRCEEARDHASAASELAQRYHDSDGSKNALYLLGEALLRLDDREGAVGAYARLQRRFFPDQPAIGEMLMQLDTLELVNLRA